MGSVTKAVEGREKKVSTHSSVFDKTPTIALYTHTHDDVNDNVCRDNDDAKLDATNNKQILRVRRAKRASTTSLEYPILEIR